MTATLDPMSIAVKAALRVKYRRSQQSRSFREWLPHRFPAMMWDAAHQQLIYDVLDRVTSGEVNKVIITLPPRHFKSETVTIRYAAWRLINNPDMRVIIGSYNQTLAVRFSRRIRNIVRDEIPISMERKAADDWETSGKGGLRAVGVGGGVTGVGGDLIIIDDPVKSREEADSPAYRERLWDWYTDDLYTRREPGAAVILIMCMTGDTPVLMADGTERLLRDIKTGDRVATYDNGKLSTSKVLNHRSNGLDSVFRIKTICGKIVYANERHPFLVEDHGQLKWIRLRNLTTAHKIVTVRDSGESGKGSSASLTDVTSPSAREGTAPHITTRSGGLMGIGHHRTIQSHGDLPGSSTDTELLPLNTTPCSQHKTASVPFASNHPETTYAPIGAESSVSTTVTTPTPFERSSATTVTLQSDMPELPTMHSPLPSTSDFTTTQIESIEPAGVEEVFDVQIERTENFIANGLVTHNTRWHMDDLAGRILQSDDGPNWEVVHLPAIALEDDPLGREPGEALMPERYDVDALADIRGALGDRGWYALYQGMPQPEGGAVFLREWWDGQNRYDPRETFRPVARTIYWDTAEEDKDSAAFTVGAVFELDADYTARLVDVVRQRVTFPDLVPLIERTAKRHNRDGMLRAVDVEYASSGRQAYQTIMAQSPEWLRRIMRRSTPKTSKELRAQAAAAWCQSGMVHLPMPDESLPWLHDLESELYDFPTGTYKDQVDAFSGGINRMKQQLTMGFRQRRMTQTERLDNAVD